MMVSTSGVPLPSRTAPWRNASPHSTESPLTRSTELRPKSWIGGRRRALRHGDDFEQGDIVYLDFDPQSGHEQKGRRPALVISNNLFNRVSSLTMVCPITHTDRGHPFHLRLDERTRTDGVILCDQARMLDLNSRHASFVERAPEDISSEAVDMVIGFLEPK